jgi:hypothetical protein
MEMTTEEELARLEMDVLPPGSRVWITHYFSHPGLVVTERAVFREAGH